MLSVGSCIKESNLHPMGTKCLQLIQLRIFIMGLDYKMVVIRLKVSKGGLPCNKNQQDMYGRL